MQGFTEAATVLLEHGADFQAETKVLGVFFVLMGMQEGYTALAWAKHNRNTEVAWVLQTASDGDRC